MLLTTPEVGAFTTVRARLDRRRVVRSLGLEKTRMPLGGQLRVTGQARQHPVCAPHAGFAAAAARLLQVVARPS
jgi:hypothetical protein